MSLARRLGSLDATLIVIGGIVGAGIFVNPSVVAQHIPSGGTILALWVFGAIVAIAGGFVFAELACARPNAGGLYGYVRDGISPLAGFMYGWTALLVSQSGGMAAAAVAFAAYAHGFGLTALPVTATAVLVIVLLSGVNMLGVRQGGTLQNTLLAGNMLILAVVIVAGLVVHTHASNAPSVTSTVPGTPLLLIGAALIPVFYAYDGWQTAAFMDREISDAPRALSRGLIFGVLAVSVLYIGITLSGLHALGAHGLAGTSTPFITIMHATLGPFGEHLVGAGVALSILGFLSNSILTSPRIYYAMAQDDVFFKTLATVHPRTKVPIWAIVVQGSVACAIALSGSYAQILNYVTSMDFLFIAACAATLFIFRRRNPGSVRLMPGHPLTTIVFIAICLSVVASSYLTDPRDSLIGAAILASGAPIYWLWKRRRPAGTLGHSEGY